MSSLVPRFKPSVCIHNNTCEWKTGENFFANLPILCIIVYANGRSKWGRAGTEAIMIVSFLVQSFLCD